MAIIGPQYWERWQSNWFASFEWFVKKEKKNWEQYFASALEGNNVSGNFYQNDIESIPFIEKSTAQKMKFSVKDFFSECK